MACCRGWSQLFHAAAELLYEGGWLDGRGGWSKEHRRVPLRITAGPPCRWCVCRAELAGEPRSIAHLHGT